MVPSLLVSLMSDGLMTTFFVGRFSCFSTAAIAKIATWRSGMDADISPCFPPTFRPHRRKTDLSYVDGVVREALSEVQDAVGGEGVIVSELQRQQICRHVFKLPGPETELPIRDETFSSHRPAGTYRSLSSRQSSSSLTSFSYFLWNKEPEESEALLIRR